MRELGEINQTTRGRSTRYSLALSATNHSLALSRFTSYVPTVAMS